MCMTVPDMSRTKSKYSYRAMCRLAYKVKKATKKIKKQLEKNSSVLRMTHYKKSRPLTMEEMMDSVDDTAPAFVEILNQLAQNPTSSLVELNFDLDEILSGSLEVTPQDQPRIYHFFRTKNKFYVEMYYRKPNLIYSTDPNDPYVFRD